MDGDELTSQRAPFGSSTTVDPPAEEEVDAFADPEGESADDAERSGLDADAETDEPIPPWWWPMANYPGETEARKWLQRVVSAMVVIGCGVYVFWVVHPELVFRNTTPTGGDMGSHVWGPAYLRDHLLPNLRLTGWTTDWYAGFPAYTFYMVVPSLMILLLSVGFLPWWLLPVSFAGFGWLAVQARRRTENRVLRVVAYVGCLLAAFLVVDIPYNVAFKLIACLGIVTLPGCVWYFAKGLGLRFGGPEILAIATLPFLVDKTLFHIYGGNIASTMAGEFAFSISLSFAFLFLGVTARGISTGRYAPWGAVLFALCALCHVIPMFFAVVGALVLLALRPTKRALVWLFTAAIPGGMMAMFWYLPFYFNSTYMNDMGWEKLGPMPNDQGVKVDNLTEYLRHLFPFAPHTQDNGQTLYEPNMLHGKFFLVLAIIGIILSLVLVVRAGIFLTAMTGIAALAFWLMPQTRFWNARVLPFYYLCIYLLAGLGIWLIVRAVVLIVKGEWSQPPPSVAIATIVFVAVVTFTVLGVSLRTMPGGKLVTAADGTQSYSWLGIDTTYSGPVRGWAEWNFSGLEAKGEAWTEFEGLIDEMGRVGEEEGCGRSLWEYDSDFLGRYGTPMAPMMLPYFTDGCIGSQEGLYFEASATTPFHFVMQDELSAKCSCAQRWDIFDVDPSPYNGFDLDAGINHLQMIGVKYYLAFTDRAKTAADADDRLTLVGESGPWKVYEVAGVSMVEGLDAEPAVWTDVDDDIHSWAKPAVEWFEDSAQWGVQRASDGPDDWQRVTAGETPERVVVDAAEVSNIEVGRDSISFDVDEIGKPVLVRMSYFPNWEIEGAEGPYRVAPNQMVVVPTSTTVEMSYGRSAIEWWSMLISLVGLGLVLLVIRRGDPQPAHVPFEFIGDRDELRPPEPSDDEMADDEMADDDPAAPMVPATGGDLSEPT